MGLPFSGVMNMMRAMSPSKFATMQAWTPIVCLIALNPIPTGDSQALQPAKHSARAPMPGKYVLLHSADYGVFCGVLVSIDGSSVHLSDARRIACWPGRDELHHISLHGPGKNDRFTETIDEVQVHHVTRVVACVKQAEQKLRCSPVEMI